MADDNSRNDTEDNTALIDFSVSLTCISWEMNADRSDGAELAGVPAFSPPPPLSTFALFLGPAPCENAKGFHKMLYQMCVL